MSRHGEGSAMMHGVRVMSRLGHEAPSALNGRQHPLPNADRAITGRGKWTGLRRRCQSEWAPTKGLPASCDER